MGTLFKKLTSLVKDGFTRTVPLSFEDTGHEENMKNESDAHEGRLSQK